jgi:hypothetical protein
MATFQFGVFMRAGVLISLAVAALCALSAATSQAGVSLATNRTAIVADTTVDWGSLGAEFTSVANGSSFSLGTVAGSASSFAVLSGATYNADFAATDNLLALFNAASGEPAAGLFAISFLSPVQAAGAQIQANLAGSFAGTIRAFDTTGLLLGSFNVVGANGQNGDGSASFAGIVSDAADIKRIEFVGFGDGAAINQLSVDTVATPVPEASTTLNLLAGLLTLTLGAVARRRTNTGA